MIKKLAGVCAILLLAHVITYLFGPTMYEMFTSVYFWLVLPCALMGAILYLLILLRGEKRVDPNQRLEQIAKSLAGIDKSLIILLSRLYPDSAAAVVEFYTTINGVKTKVDKMFMKIGAVADLVLAPKAKLPDGSLVDAKVDGVPVWALTDEAAAKLEVAADGMSAVLTVLTLRPFKVQGKVDADLGEGVREVNGELDIEVSPLEAETVELSATIRP